ncbi:hypothetical protein L6452_38954 [Arctium lappa]|uniref:Uncharacterized protein n=1 Tax=Arctium lappa TaxID=4217 RepID=A0ACB8XR74_ARCLA|nr:hypothetical protein L6452_38954 [Arctium lappa]
MIEGVDASSPETVSSVESPKFSGELRKAEPPQHVVEMPESLENSQSSPPENDTGHPIATPTKSTPLIPVTQIKDGTQKSKSSVTEGDDNKQRRSPSVIAKLMGLEPLSPPSTLSSSDKKSPKTVARKPAIKRSASKSRVSRDLFHSKYIDGNNFQVKQPKQTVEHIVGDEGRDLSNKGFANV